MKVRIYSPGNKWHGTAGTFMHKNRDGYHHQE